MANGIKALRQIQMSRETTQGAATTDNWNLWRGVGTMLDTTEVYFVPEDVGYLSGLDRTYIPQKGGELVLEETEATFQQMGYIFDSGFYEATPTTDTGTGTGYIRTYTLPTTVAKASTDLQTYYFKVGDNNDVEEAGFGFVPEFSMTGTAGGSWKFTGKYETRTVSTSAAGFEASPTLPAVESMLFTKTTLYIDATTDDYGDTEVAATLLAADLQIQTGWQSVHNASGQLYFGYIKQVMPELLLNVTFEHNTSAVTEKDAWKAETARKIRLGILGSTLTAAGAHTYYTLLVDLTGKWESFDKLGDQNGNDVVSGVFRARYNTTAATFAAFTLVNETAAY